LIENLEPSLSSLSQKDVLLRLFVGVFLGLILGLVLGLAWGLFTGIYGGLIVSLIFGSLKTDIQIRTIPNQGIFQSLKSAIVLATLAITLTPILYLCFSVVLPTALPSYEVTTTIKPIIELNILMPTYIAFYFGGGFACIQHFALRFVLYSSGSIPWNYARFLNYCGDRLLLQRIGGRYRFIHKLVQEHFAAMPENDLNP
ncbi:MAG: hypothetical protein WBA43_21650, partial [Elainellaceae cyanobacterium]